MDGIKGTFRGVMSDIDRMTKDGVTSLGTMSFQQFKPTGTTVSHYQQHRTALRSSCNAFRKQVTLSCDYCQSTALNTLVPTLLSKLATCFQHVYVEQWKADKLDLPTDLAC